MFIPRVGQEVVVEFLEGNPDRPLITGVVYNANMKVPYPLPDNKTRSTIKTNSSKGGSGFNELRFEDKAGEEEVYFHAEGLQKGRPPRRDGNHPQQHRDDGGDGRPHGDGLQGGDSLTVSTGNHTITVSAGKSAVTAAQSITLSVGTNSVKIDNTGVTINGMMVSLQSQATMSLQAGAPMSLTAPTISLELSGRRDDNRPQRGS